MLPELRAVSRRTRRNNGPLATRKHWYHEGAKPEDGRRFRPRAPARLFVIRAPDADLGLTELLEQEKQFLICPKAILGANTRRGYSVQRLRQERLIGNLATGVNLYVSDRGNPAR